MKLKLLLMQGCCLALVAFASNVMADTSDLQYLPEMLTVELSPRMRPEPLSATIYSLESEKIKSYIENVLIYDDIDQYETLPYVVGFDRNANIGGPGDLAYTKGLHFRNDVAEFSLLQPGNTLEHPITGETLGLEVFVIGRGVVQDFGPTQSLLITDSKTSIEINTRLLPLIGVTLPGVLDIKYPLKPVHGFILSIPDTRELAGSYSVVVVSVGKRDGIKQGNVLDIVEGLREVTDPNRDKDVELPSAKVGEVLIFSVREKMSLGIIGFSKRLIVIGDELSVPPLGN